MTAYQQIRDRINANRIGRVKLMDNGLSAVDVPNVAVANDTQMSLRYCLTAPVVDREGDVVMPDGIYWGDHQKNPLVLFNHKMDMPTGLSRTPGGLYTVERVDDRWFGEVFLFQGDRQSEEYYHMAKKGALNGASIGFLPPKPPFGEVEMVRQDNFHVRVIKRCTIFEWSMVYLPMCQDALGIASEVIGKGMNGRSFS